MITPKSTHQAEGLKPSHPINGPTNAENRPTFGPARPAPGVQMDNATDADARADAHSRTASPRTARRVRARSAAPRFFFSLDRSRSDALVFTLAGRDACAGRRAASAGHAVDPGVGARAAGAGGGQKVHIGGVAHTHLAVSPAAVWGVGRGVVVGGVWVREVCYGD